MCLSLMFNFSDILKHFSLSIIKMCEIFFYLKTCDLILNRSYCLKSDSLKKQTKTRKKIMVNLSFKSSNFPGSLNFLMKFAGDKLQVILYKSVCGIPPQMFFSKDMGETLQVMHLLFGMEDKKVYKMKSFDLHKKAAHTYLMLPVICKIMFLKFGKK